MNRPDLGGRTLALPTVALVVLFLAVNAALVAGVTTSGAPLGPYNYEWDGGSTLRSELGDGTDRTVLATDTDAYGSVDPDSTVAVVVGPRERYSAADAARLDRFLARGGTLLVAGEGSPAPGADTGTAAGAGPANALLASLGVVTRINGTTVVDDRYNDGGAVLPRAINVADHPLVAGVDRLTLGRGSVLDVPGRAPGVGGSDGRRVGNRSAAANASGVSVLVRTSSVAALDRNGNGTLDGSEPLGPFPVAAVESVGAGRVVVVSDTTLFTDAYLERDGNRAFVGGLTRRADAVVLDYSHGAPLPPLTALYVAVERSALLQALVGLLGLGAVALWLVRPSLPGSERVRRWVRGGGPDGRRDGTVDLDAEEVAAAVRERHPDWDPDSVERVSQTIIRRRGEE